MLVDEIIKLKEHVVWYDTDDDVAVSVIKVHTISFPKDVNMLTKLHVLMLLCYGSAWNILARYMAYGGGWCVLNNFYPVMTAVGVSARVYRIVDDRSDPTPIAHT